MQFKAYIQSPLEKQRVRREQRLQLKREVSTKDSYRIIIWQDTSVLTFRELQEEIPSKSESPQRAIHSTWRWDNVVPRSLKKETIQALFEWTKELKTCFMFPKTWPLLLASKHVIYKKSH